LPGNITLAVAEIADQVSQPSKRRVTVQFSDFSNETLPEPKASAVTSVTVPQYTEPVSQLLSLGRPNTIGKADAWANYEAQYHLTASDIPELIRLSTDEVLYDLDREPEVYAGIHAWRALGQLKATEALAPLLDFLARPESALNDWIHEDFPVVFTLLGPEALPLLEDFLADSAHREFARIAVVSTIRKMAKAYPDYRDRCMTLIMAQLQKQEAQAKSLNGFLIAALIEEKVLESVPLIESVYTAGCVDVFVCGSLEKVFIDMGVKEPTPEYLEARRRQEEKGNRLLQLCLQNPPSELPLSKSVPSANKKLKAQKKQVKLSRKKNRRK